jgi:multiple sugar transport system permease protein
MATKREATVAFWVFMAPMLIGLFIFTFVPIGWGFLLSLSDARNSVDIGNFIGFGNYAFMLQSPQFQDSLLTIIIFTIFIVPLTLFASLGLAMLVNGADWGRGIFRTASLIWRMSLFSGVPSGVMNMVLYEWFGIEAPVSWITSSNPPWYWLVLVSVRLWLQVGLYMIIFIAGLQEIPRSLYEAAFVDGARTGWMTFRHITLPMLRNTMVAVLLLNLIAAFQAFDEFWNIMGGTAASAGNRSLARPPLVYLYQVALGDQDYGRGTAGAFILTAIIIGVTLLQGRFFGFGRQT